LCLRHYASPAWFDVAKVALDVATMPKPHYIGQPTVSLLLCQGSQQQDPQC
jgi:hypothetical protein